MRFFAPLLIAPLVLAGCASERVASTQHTRREIVQIAVAVAQKSGCHLDDYKAPRPNYDPRFGDWWVMFPQKPPGFPGGDIIVSVDDSSGVAKFISAASED